MGLTPIASLTLSGGTLYGTTEGGGANGYGMVFSVPVLTGGSPTTLATFNGANGANPYHSLDLVHHPLRHDFVRRGQQQRHGVLGAHYRRHAHHVDATFNWPQWGWPLRQP